jgi:hypothetical protein
VSGSGRRAERFTWQKLPFREERNGVVGVSDTEKLADILARRGDSFFHFTDTRNLPSIRQHGLLSMRELRSRGIVATPGGNQWSLDADVRSGMDRFVHLCFLGEHPMEWRAKQDGRIVDSRFLRIDPSVITIAGTVITDQVANKAGVIPKAAETMLGELDLEVIYKRLDWKDSAIRSRRQSAKLYEILVPDNVPANLIRNLG